jgi:hypothetical protein
MAQKLRIELTDDDYDCETCGLAYATGAKIYVDGILSLDLVPKAHCFNQINYDHNEIMRRALELVGIELEQANEIIVVPCDETAEIDAGETTSTEGKD